MTTLLRVLNAFYAALFLVGAIVSLGFFAAALKEFAREPEDVWISIEWTLLFTMLAALCFANMRKSGRPTGPPLIAANAAALLLAAAGLAMVGDPVVQWIAGVSILPFAITLPAQAAARRRRSA